MNVCVAVLCLAALALAAPNTPLNKEVVPIVHHAANIEHDGHYHYSYESGDGTKVEQNGELRVYDKEHAGEVVQGRVSYQGDDGKTYTLTYVADENGYQPQGDHLPVAPAVPEAIARALEYIATHPQKEEKSLKH